MKRKNMIPFIILLAFWTAGCKTTREITPSPPNPQPQSGPALVKSIEIQNPEPGATQPPLPPTGRARARARVEMFAEILSDASSA